MKKLSLVCVKMLVSVYIYSQQTPASIEVKGTVYFVPTVYTYSTQIVISQDFLYDYYNGDVRSLDEIKQEYFQKMAAEGIDPKGFKEDKLSYLSLGYKKGGTLLIIDTNKKKDIETIIGNTIPGARVNGTYVKVSLPNKKTQELATKAIEKLRKKAEMIAEKQNRKVGAILKIVDHQEDEISNFGMVPTYHEKAKYPYSVTVTFALL